LIVDRIFGNMLHRMLVLLMLGFMGISSSQATHLMGGEITWTCLGGGNYRFQMRVYRDCTTPVPVVPPGGSIILRVHNHPTVTSIPMTQVSFTDMSPQCNGAGPTYNCITNPAGSVAVEEYIYQSNPVNLPGTPPAQGWVFTWSDCCRNAAIVNLSLSFNAGGPSNGFTLRAVMYPYNGQNTQPCYDSSPVFQEKPAIIICAGNSFVYNHNAYDPDKDSLVYSFAESLDYLQPGTAFTPTNPPAIPYIPGFSATSPFPGPGLGSPNNVPATLDPSTGELSFNCFLQGAFVNVIRVQSFRCGQLIAEIYREIQVVVIQCGNNSPPVVTPPFQNPITGLFTEFVDTVMAGDLVQFNIGAVDNDLLPTFTPQSVVINAAGGQFGANFNDPNSGCDNLPCATLNPAPPASNLINNSTTFNWQTSCEHTFFDNDCYVANNVHTFTFNFKDDFCPAPSYKTVTVTIVVQPVPLVEAPDLRCLAVQSNGDILLTWLIPPDPDGTFNSYHIYSSTNLNGPYTLIDSIFVYNQNTYLHSGAGGNTASRYYYVRTRSGCFGRVLTEPSDTLQSLFASIGNLSGITYPVSWNALSTPLPASAGPAYEILKESTGGFMAFSQTTQLSILDSVDACISFPGYRVELPDASGCTSVSNEVRETINLNEPVPVLPLDSVSIDPATGQAIAGWQSGGLDTTRYQVVIYQNQNGNWVPLDTLAFSDAGFYLNSLSNAADSSESYALSLIDTCGNTGPLSPAHSTMTIALSGSSCSNAANIGWSDYAGFSVGAYHIYASENGGPFVRVATAPGSANGYLYENLNSGSTYCFRVTAVSQSGLFSSSTIDSCFSATTVDEPEFVYMNYATVENDFTANLRAFFDANSDALEYVLTRRDVYTGKLDSLGPFRLPANGNFIDHTDQGLRTQETPYQYQLFLKDSCGNWVGVTNFGTTIHLSGSAVPGFYNKLNWTPYSEWSGGVARYRIYKCSSKECDDMVFEAETDSATFRYIEDVMDTLPPSGLICYRIEAIEGPGNIYFFSERSLSNVICLEHRPVIYIPNAFSPLGGHSSEFRPRGVFASFASAYLFRIYNRWGEVIFETRDPDKGWDGTYMGSRVPTGAYVYQVIIDTYTGDRIDKTGSVTVLY
jgi:gliding motility-associated-like protein